MSRFEIEDIVEQDKHGVVFRAHDTESGDIVALRRFLPFGPDGGGLEKEEAAAFKIASKRLAEVSHIALRSVIVGSVDPIDGIPFLVTEWVDGTSLGKILAGEKLDHSLVIDVLRIALEVSVVLSNVLGEEAVWVETEVESIIVGTKDSDRGFTFWICPFKWLGSEPETRKLSSIVNLCEELAGWKRKVLSDQAGHGLGRWIKWLKKNPEASLGEALAMLESSTAHEPPPAETKPVERTINPQSLQLKQPSTKKPLAFAALALLLVIPAAVINIYRAGMQPEIAKDSIEQQISPEIVRTSSPFFPKENNTAPASTESKLGSKITQLAHSEPAAPQDATASANALAKKLREMADAKDKAFAATALDKADKPAPANPNAGAVKTYTPGDLALWADIKGGTPVKLRGTIRSVGSSVTGKTIYLFYILTPDRNLLAVALHKNKFIGDFSPQAFAPFVGKEVIVSGSCFKELKGRICVLIQSANQIQIVE